MRNKLSVELREASSKAKV